MSPQNPRSRVRIAGSAASVVIVIGTLAAAGSFRANPLPASGFFRIETVRGDATTVGGPAPEIAWRDPATGRSSRLSDLRGKPVVLFSGSVTCPPFRLLAPLMERYARTYRDHARFLFVYSREAHPEYGSSPHTREQKSLARREEAALELLSETRLSMPVLIDGLDNAVEKACGDVPSRIVVIDASGTIAHVSGYPSSMNAGPIPGILDRLIAEPGPYVSPSAKPMQVMDE